MKREIVKSDFEEWKRNCIRVRSIQDLPLLGVNNTAEIFKKEDIIEMEAFNEWEIYQDLIGISILIASNIDWINKNINLFIRFLKMLKNLRYLILDGTNITANNLWLILEVCTSLERLSYISAIQEKYDSDQQYFSELK